MRLRQIDHDTIEIDAPAKVNLFLEVLGKRADGYHELETVMMGISIIDRLRFRRRSDSHLELRVHLPRDCSMESAWSIPSDSSNLVVKGLDSIRRLMGHEQGMDVWLWKGIPAQAGMGGGSSDAAAALIAASLLWEGKWERDAVCQTAASLGSDINFFIEGIGKRFCVAHCTGRGEVVRPLHLAEPLALAVIQPPEGCSTRAVFQGLRQIGEKTPNKNLLTALESGNVSQLGAHLFNRLEESACQESDWIQRVKSEMDAEDVLGHVMSGSGASRFALCHTRELANRVAKRLQGRLPVLAFEASTWSVPSLEAQMKSMGIQS